MLLVDKDREILRAKELLKIDYNPDCIVQHYYKQVNDARLLLMALKETVKDEEIKRNAYPMFEKHIDLKEVCRKWNRTSETSWEEMKKHFSREIQMNVTDPSVIRRNEQANVFINQYKQREETQRQQMELAILQTQKIQELEMTIQEQTTNIVTDNRGGIPRQVLAPINNNTSGGTSTTSTVSKEEMMQTFAQFTKNFNPEHTKENNRQAPKKKK